MRKAEPKTVIDQAATAGAGSESAGDRLALDRLFSATYEDLRRLASQVRRGDPSATLTPTALVNEAWLKLSNSVSPSMQSELHFKRIAARAMRQLLVDAARRRQADKRGGGETPLTVSFADELQLQPADDSQLLGLNAALESLQQIHPRQAAMVEFRFFGGLEIPAIAQLLQISEATVLRDWRAARAWLAREIHTD